MKEFTVTCTRYGFATVEAETEEDALEAGKKLDADDFYWCDPEEHDIVQR